ncbi:FadR/GntR family transcriptional regulator [Rossellomorea aquimaris]|jgi:GntR family transcriptional regulator, transcriptional repressor for pyruvate dehydrogenase complex|uniref:FadR/GntR family transcriptional regulator n=1 Tax=Rossellomorea aquimaris TaxID=189382 RepID=UPI000A8B935B|nr:GntR family transcriptional regulator [Rossellomorea aquimaris]
MMTKVNSLHSQSKVYIGIVHQLREMISKDGLKKGDKIPSERELSERLNVGRSSVREALRALELLGLIETRRGEGTFLRDFRDHHLIDLLGMFILQDQKAKEDIKCTKTMIEKEALRTVFCQKLDTSAIKDLVKDDNGTLTWREIVEELILLSNNYLSHRIWNVLNDYETFIIGEKKITPEIKEKLLNLLQGLENQDKESVQTAYRQISEISDRELTNSNIFL